MTEERKQVTTEKLEALKVMANRLRKHSLTSTTEAGSGHPTSCFSCAELVSTIFFHFLRYDLDEPDNQANDRFVLSKGHAAPVLWAALAEAGAFPVENLEHLRRIDCDLEGHPTPRSQYVDVATGSLGQGLSNAVGMALASKIDGISNRVFTLLGDGESAEGSVWEAAALASYYDLSHLIAIVDVNRLGQSEATMYGHKLSVYESRFRSFGWDTRVIDGHDISEIIAALEDALDSSKKPTAIIAQTYKGKGVSFLEDADGWHGKPVSDKDQFEQALDEIGRDLELPIALKLAKPAKTILQSADVSFAIAAPEYGEGAKVATREAYGSGLAKLGKVNDLIVSLDGDVKNSTYAEKFKDVAPGRFVECYIAEQNMVGAAAGMAALGKIPFASSFACFLSRAYDFIRMAGISQVNLKLCGSHAGVSIGEDGPSQMALEDLAMMRAVVNSKVLYPSDAVSSERLVALAAKTPGIVYIRTSRPKTPILYDSNEEFTIGGSKVLRSSGDDQATVIGAGVTLHEALKAYDQLQEEGISIRVIDLYSVKPVDTETLARAVEETGCLLTVEDHYPEGGIAEAVCSALAGKEFSFRALAVNGLPRSGDSKQLMEEFGISAHRIIEAVHELT